MRYMSWNLALNTLDAFIAKLENYRLEEDNIYIPDCFRHMEKILEEGKLNAILKYSYSCRKLDIHESFFVCKASVCHILRNVLNLILQGILI